MEKDLIAFDGTLFQVLELPVNPPQANANQSVEPPPLVALAAKMVKEV